MKAKVGPCVFCDEDGGELIWSDLFARVVRVADEDHPGFCRVIVKRHAREMTDLDSTERDALMRIVFATEHALRDILKPDKINLASLGNMVPHVHWHVIPRFRLDPHYPNPVWGSRTAGRAQSLPRDFVVQLGQSLISQLGAPV